MNIVFDFAGVVFHWDPLSLLRRQWPQHATDEARTAELFAQVFQGWGGDWGEFDRGTLEPEPLAQRIAARTGLPVHDVRQVMQAIPRELAPHPPTVALLRRLQARGHRLFFLSNMPAPYADVLEAEHDFLALFEDGVISARVGAIKPEPAIFDLASARFGVEPQHLLFIDDVLANVQAARDCGWQALQFTSAAQVGAVLEARGALD